MTHAWLGQDIERELADGLPPLALVRKLGLPTRTLDKGNLSTSLVTLSPLSRGHVVVFANSDHRSFSALVRDCGEAADEAEQLIAKHRSIYGPSILFEHGMRRCGGNACGVTRAHYHMVPFSAVDALTGSVAGELGPPDLGAGPLWRPEMAECEYVALGSSVHEAVAWTNRAFPSQLVRRHLGALLGLDRWDWKELFGWADMRATAESWQTPN